MDISKNRKALNDQEQVESGITHDQAILAEIEFYELKIEALRAIEGDVTKLDPILLEQGRHAFHEYSKYWKSIGERFWDIWVNDGQFKHQDWISYNAETLERIIEFVITFTFFFFPSLIPDPGAPSQEIQTEETTEVVVDAPQYVGLYQEVPDESSMELLLDRLQLTDSRKTSNCERK
ncbi:hypothetical protein CROQUDRAFT_715420 [Cronartium quercuum f. sp. fusiforme G11]|uniref:Uncharacterized protein n=1 Tax=Cronartium quercuum f. sp. fusiforme G11 TaxID=708437 RepID=A0A9P6TDJ0_9BASI|nr:hypothetical protein CROQUDRAFT_715420 [Cronartium quercuum f. sp. fusiforme G11]